ncbi:hypothetical protein BDZ89DRAFT_1046837 [Hymenopellis radicata]|nr:hypothetical protein BDZ89DRAFT_1046837 [Hymenopellis radicata]
MAEIGTQLNLLQSLYNPLPARVRFKVGCQVKSNVHSVDGIYTLTFVILPKRYAGEISVERQNPRVMQSGGNTRTLAVTPTCQGRLVGQHHDCSEEEARRTAEARREESGDSEKNLKHCIREFLPDDDPSYGLQHETALDTVSNDDDDEQSGGLPLTTLDVEDVRGDSGHDDGRTHDTRCLVKLGDQDQPTYDVFNALSCYHYALAPMA